MPTLVMVDCSLSMLQQIGGTEESGKSLAFAGLSHFFHLLQDTNRYEYIALAGFSIEVKSVQTFTRDFPSLVLLCSQLETDSKTLLEPALNYAANECSRTWCSGTKCQVLIVTDGLGAEINLSEIKKILPFKFDSFLHIVCVSPRSDILGHSLDALNDVIELTDDGGKLYCLDRPTRHGVHELFSTIVEQFYAPTFSLLTCGRFSATVQISPPFSGPTKSGHKTTPQDSNFGSTLEVLGFLLPAELGNAPVVAKHLVLPLASGQSAAEKRPSQKPEDKTPNLCVLLHGGLKVAGTVAVCKIGPNYYGVLFHLPESTSKKSNLVLYCLAPGSLSVPWLGRWGGLTNRAYTGAPAKSPFPLQLRPKPSYALNCTSWVDPTTVFSDIQKLLRYARKIPERQTQFYQELNRLYRHAVAVGLASLLEKLEKLLEREARQTSSPDIKRQLNHALQQLKPEAYRVPEESLLFYWVFLFWLAFHIILPT